MTKNSKIILSCLISIMLATSASATWVPLTAEVPLSFLQGGGSIIFGDKEISEFDMFSFSGGGALAPNPDAMFVQGGKNSITGDYGLKFNLSWSAISNQTVNATLSFKVSVLPGYDDALIKDVTMVITGSSVTGAGGVSIGETVWDAAPFSGGNVIASLSSSKQYGDGGAYLSDHAEFAPIKEIWTWSKEISVTGGTSGSGLANLSEFYQFYSQTQIPEPATLVLLGLGTLSLFRRKRKA
jgi:hypothetical protein